MKRSFLLLGLLVACAQHPEPGASERTLTARALSLTYLIRVEPLPPGDVCPTGGLSVQTGRDRDSDGVLDPEEVTSQSDLCNGEEGPAGLDGLSAAMSFEEAPLEQCEAGGVAISWGLDLNANGALDASEVLATDYVCNGRDGTSSLTRLDQEPAGTNCPSGGVAIRTGTDLDRDGSLDDEEVIDTEYVCNGVDPCHSVVCDSPPSVCFAAIGTCDNGECTYAFQDDASCDDGESCTDNDACSGGVCAGSPRICEAPPAPVCLDAATLRVYSSSGTCEAGSCSYSFSDSLCPESCEAGACVEAPSCDLACTTSPASSCLDAGTVRTYEAVGACEVDACAYSFADAVCSGSCTAGTCRPCAGGFSPAVTVDGPADVRNPSVAIDSVGGVHITYQGDYFSSGAALKYAYAAPGGSWTLRTIDSATALIRSCNDAALDAQGTLHVVYGGSGAVRHAWMTPDGEWSIETVATTADGCGSALDAAGGLHVVYYSARSFETRYATKRQGASTWTDSLVSYHTAKNISVAVSPSGDVHATYVASSSPNAENTLRLTRSAGSATWSVTTHATNSYHSRPTSTATDRNGGVHVMYATVAYLGLPTHIWYSAPAGYGAGEISVGSTSSYHSFEVDVDSWNGAHLVYGGDASGLFYRYRRPDLSSETLTVAPATGTFVWSPSVAVDASGGVHVVYLDCTLSTREVCALRYAVRSEC